MRSPSNTDKREKDILDALKLEGKMMRRDLERLVGVGKNKVLYTLNKLIDEGKVKRERKGRNLRFYKINTEYKEDDRMEPSHYNCNTCPYWDPVNDCLVGEKDAWICDYKRARMACKGCMNFDECAIEKKISLNLEDDCVDYLNEEENRQKTEAIDDEL